MPGTCAGTSCSGISTWARPAQCASYNYAQALHGVRSDLAAVLGTSFAPPMTALAIINQGVRYVELGACVFHHRHHRGDLRLHGHRCRCGGNRQDPVRRLRGPLPGLAGRGPAEKALTVGVPMQIKLLSIAAAVAFAFAGAAAQAQSTMTDKPRVGERADRTADAKPSVDRKARKAEEDRIEADYKAEKAKCGPMKGHEKEICDAEAKGKENVAKAEMRAKYDPSPANERKVSEAKAEHEYKVAKEKCDVAKGKEENACEKEAKAKYDRAKADIKAKSASTERRAATGSTSTERTK